MYQQHMPEDYTTEIRMRYFLVLFDYPLEIANPHNSNKFRHLTREYERFLEQQRRMTDKKLAKLFASL